MTRVGCRIFAILVVVAGVLGVPASGSAATRTWWVSASSPTAGNGTKAHPFRTLTAVERASKPADTIIVLPSPRALDGGVRLKRGQRLIGYGEPVRSLAPTAPAPQVTNTTGDRLGGDAVRLADGAVVRNLRIPHPFRGGVYGNNVSNVVVAGNDVYGHNTSCSKGFLIPQFNAPTNVPGVGIPIVGGLPNGWAGVMIDADSRTGATAVVRGNRVHDAECGDGIDVRLSGTAAYRVRVVGNRVHGLRQAHSMKSVLAIGFQARDRSRLVAVAARNRQRNLGNPDDLNLGPEGADSEGVFVNGVGPSTMHVTVVRNDYRNVPGVGGFSANGLEMVTMGKGSRATVVVRDSHFSGSTGDVIEEGALGTDANLRMVLDNVVAERSSGIGNTVVLPFNNGDCVLAGSLGARNDVRLAVRDSVLRDCANNGLSFGSNVVNGRGPTRNLSLDIVDSKISGNRGGNLAIRNFTRLESLSVRVAGTDLAGSPGLGSAISDLEAEDLASTGRSVIDLGGGALGSPGQNCIGGGGLAAAAIRYDVAARNNWWGRAGGPRLLETLAVLATIDTGSPLAAPPGACAS